MSRSTQNPLRRRLLQGLVAAGVGGYVTTSAGSSTDDWKHVLVIDDSATADSFRRGVESKLLTPPVRIVHSQLDASALDALASEMRHPGRRLLGLVDSAFGILLVDSARGSGARLRLQAEFALPADPAARWAWHAGRRLAAMNLDGAPEAPPRDFTSAMPARHASLFVLETSRESARGRT